MQTRRKWLTLAIVSATLALVFAPVFIPREVARWYLAAAANAYRLGDMATAAEYMGSAVAWDDDLSKEGQAMSLLLAEQYDFQNAIRAFKLTLGGKPPRSVDGLNQLAYYRALAGIELDEALADVDRAIELEGPNPLILDTKAWVLHELGRNLEALSFSNEAIKTLEVQLRNWGALDGATDEKSSADTAGAEVQNQDRQSNSGNDAIDDEAIDNEAVDNKAAELTSLWPDLVDVRERIESAKRRLSVGVYSLAVMRFHRMRIYEAVGASAEARLDRQWLRQRHVPIDDQLF